MVRRACGIAGWKWRALPRDEWHLVWLFHLVASDLESVVTREAPRPNYAGYPISLRHNLAEATKTTMKSRDRADANLPMPGLLFG